MEDLLKIRPTRFHDSERFPVVISGAGLPQFYPNTFLTADLRSRNKQYNTLISAAYAIQALRCWEMLEGINIVERMLDCRFLTGLEIDSLYNSMWHSCDFLAEKVQQKQVVAKGAGKVRSLAAYRRQNTGEKKAVGAVRAGTVASRLVYIIRYFKYLGLLGIQKENNAATRVALAKALEQMVVALAARAPEAFGGHVDAEYQRLGLTYEVEGLLREIIEPDHHMNPWSTGVQLRNNMVIEILLGLGIRGGELLNLPIEDIDLRQNKVKIRRLPDNPDDPRLYEPNVKTLPRELRMKDALAAVIQAYIVNDRRRLPGARKHDFLVVSSADGAPLSRTSFNSIFEAVRRKVPGIPSDFGAHLCRHTWNDRFSDFCDSKGIDEERERKIRCKIMGWMPGSQMALVYTKRSTQAVVDEYMLGQQGYITDSRLGELLDDINVEG